MKIQEVTDIGEFKKTIPLLLSLKKKWSEFTADYMAEKFPAAIANGYRHFVIYEDREVIGTFGLASVHNPAFFTPSYEVVNLIVKDAHRKKGVGRKIMDFCKTAAKEKSIEWLRLSAYADNKSAIGLFEKSGFRYISNYMYCRLDGEQ